jgi:glycine cleavage system H protein
MNIPDNLNYTTDHEWISFDGNIATIGITDYAQGELGDIVYVDIDADLTEIEKGQSVGTIEAVKTVSDLFGPLTGKVVELNGALADSPELINNDPYGNGWMLKVEFTNESELNDLLDSAGYRNLLGQ